MTGPVPSLEGLLQHPFFDTYRPSAGFVMRTPLLPFDELIDWSLRLKAPGLLADPDSEPDGLAQAVEADRIEGRRRLDELFRRPEVLEALYVASPDLLHGIDRWRQDPTSKKGRRAEQALWRYAVRMASRATPFGLFSGCGAGLFGPSTRLRLAARQTYRRHSRIDMAYLVALAERLESDPTLRQGLIYRPSSSLYRSGGRLRYAEARLNHRQRSFFLVALDSDDYLELVLERAAAGARLRDLIQTLVDYLVAEDPELDDDQGRRECAEEAHDYVNSLIDTQVLVSELVPPVTGPDPLEDLIQNLRALPGSEPFAEPLEAVQRGLARLDENGLGSPPEDYEAIARLLDRLPEVDAAPWLFQVDLYQPTAKRVIGTEVLDELGSAIDALHRLSVPPPEDDLIAFRSAFVELWGEGAEVPLLEALDHEVGIGFGDSSEAAEPMPLLNGLHLKSATSSASSPQTAWGKREQLLFRKWEQAFEGRQFEIELTPDDLKGLEPEDGTARPLPDAFQAMAILAAGSEQDVRNGDFSLFLGAVSGPSGARLLGRFCHGDQGIRDLVRRHGREEAALDPDALFAEVVHLPEGRVGNILCRPSLRQWEIPFLGRSGADPECQLPLDDLLVSVQGERIILRSKRHQRRVIPRLTSAHGYIFRGLAAYKFLCTLQAQDVGEFFSWNWGALEKALFLPRVRFGRTVLARARWRVERPEIDRLSAVEGADRLRAVKIWRSERRIPRRVVLADSDQRLPLDLEDIQAVDVLLDMAASQNEFVLSELFPGPGALPVSGPEGRFVHELTLPFVRRVSRSAERSDRSTTAEVTTEATTEATTPSTTQSTEPGPLPAEGRYPRSFPPGSEWLYAQIYGSPTTVDQVLIDIIAPVRRWAIDQGVADSWFFLRYGDPEWHLRVRFHGPPDRLIRELLPALQQQVEPWLADGRVRRVRLDTYRPEADRYGGPAALPFMERIFWADSEASLGLLSTFSGDQAHDRRWPLALRGAHSLLRDFGYDLEQRRQAAAAMRSGFWQTFGHDALGRELGKRLRPERQRLDSLLEDPPIPERVPDLAAGLPWLAQRSLDYGPWIEELQDLERQGRLQRPLRDIVPSLVHMHVNRMIRTAANQHELVIYDFLERLYASRLARQRRSSRSKTGQPTTQPSHRP